MYVCVCVVLRERTGICQPLVLRRMRGIVRAVADPRVNIHAICGRVIRDVCNKKREANPLRVQKV